MAWQLECNLTFPARFICLVTALKLLAVTPVSTIPTLKHTFDELSQNTLPFWTRLQLTRAPVHEDSVARPAIYKY